MPTLSLCMIVRDEATSLGRAIASFEGVADEIVVVDTGSTDDTIAVAEAHGARVVRHAWQKDFALARMAGFDAATGDWVFGLDADERLLPQSREEVRRLVLEGTAEAYVVSRRDLTANGYSEMPFVRLARLDRKRRMVGRIHERVDPSFTRISPSGIVIEHDGYLPGRNDARLRRNVELLELELAERPGQTYYLADLAHARYLLGDARWTEAFAEAIRGIDPLASRSPLPLALPLLEIALSTPEAVLPSGLGHASLDRLAERWYPRSVQLLVVRARLAFGRGDLATAVGLGTRAIGAWEDGSYDRTISFDPEIVGAELRLNLGVALAQIGRLRESLVRFEEAAKDPRFAAAASGNAAAVRVALGP